MLTPALCLVVQGAKWTMFGDRRFDYRAGQALVVSVEIPSLSQIVAASPGEPYLAVAIVFDLTTMREVLESLDTPPKVDGDVCQGVFVIDIGSQLAACVLRMIRLLDTPQAIGALYPLLMRELCYWLLTGPHGSDIAKMTVASSHTQRVISAVHNLRERFAEPVRVEELATSARLSPSAFHRQFKALTSMTPLQYQKQFRLLEARRLMLSSAMNAETASYKVGYESPSQFSREYSRMFGLAPGRDVAAFRSQVA
ncbi:AraC family transcriptional regulator N-terminal domain-containing protein [Deinococcus sp.]|uniref:AraC family transcriptional regulator n=1 Tax=Deinococcus sp. TaxID=47478 RepID=UPI003CC607AD